MFGILDLFSFISELILGSPLIDNLPFLFLCTLSTTRTLVSCLRNQELLHHKTWWCIASCVAKTIFILHSSLISEAKNEIQVGMWPHSDSVCLSRKMNTFYLLFAIAIAACFVVNLSENKSHQGKLQSYVLFVAQFTRNAGWAARWWLRLWIGNTESSNWLPL